MSQSLKDGTGTGNLAKVDDHGRLYTKANVIGHMSHHATYHKNAFTVSYETTLAGSSETPCALLHNGSQDKDIEIHWLRVSSDADIEYVVTAGETYSSGGGSITAVNTNIGTGVTSPATAYQGGASATLALTGTPSTLDVGGYLAANTCFCANYDGGVVIPAGKGIAVKATGANTNNVKVLIGFSAHAAGTKL